MQECLAPRQECQDGDITVKADLLVMRKTREFSPGRRQRACAGKGHNTKPWRCP